MKKLILTILFCPLLVSGAQIAQNVLSNAVSWGYGSVAPGDLQSIDAYAWMAPVGAGSAQASLSNAMVNGYGALSPGDLETVIAYGAANGSGNSSLSNNPATTNGTAALITFIQQNSIGGTGATNINVSGVLSGGSGVTTTIPAAFSAAGSNYMAQVAAAVTNGFHWGGLYDAAGTAKASTNGYPWSSLYDLVGAGTTAANHATNGFPWGTLYDSAGSAAAAAQATTNGYPWGTLYDSAGSAAAAAQATTNGYPWGTGATAANNSFTTNFIIPPFATNITIYLPVAAGNYIVQEELFAVARINNPYGLALPTGTLLPTKYISGYTAGLPVPFSESTVNGTNYIFTYDGDTVTFSDQSHYGPVLIPTNVTNAFTITARYTWTIHK